MRFLLNIFGKIPDNTHKKVNFDKGKLISCMYSYTYYYMLRFQLKKTKYVVQHYDLESIESSSTGMVH